MSGKAEKRRRHKKNKHAREEQISFAKAFYNNALDVVNISGPLGFEAEAIMSVVATSAVSTRIYTTSTTILFTTLLTVGLDVIGAKISNDKEIIEKTHHFLEQSADITSSSGFNFAALCVIAAKAGGNSSSNSAKALSGFFGIVLASIGAAVIFDPEIAAKIAKTRCCQLRFRQRNNIDIIDYQQEAAQNHWFSTIAKGVNSFALFYGAWWSLSSLVSLCVNNKDYLMIEKLFNTIDYVSLGLSGSYGLAKMAVPIILRAYYKKQDEYLEFGVDEAVSIFEHKWQEFERGLSAASFALYLANFVVFAIKQDYKLAYLIPIIQLVVTTLGSYISSRPSAIAEQPVITSVSSPDLEDEGLPLLRYKKLKQETCCGKIPGLALAYNWLTKKKEQPEPVYLVRPEITSCTP